MEFTSYAQLRHALQDIPDAWYRLIITDLAVRGYEKKIFKKGQLSKELAEAEKKGKFYKIGKENRTKK
jgi:hypothetical protein